MEETLRKAQAAANEARAPMYVFRAFGLNGDEVSWFNLTGKKNSPKDEIYQIVEPENDGNADE
ncbi:hypothetical protein LGM57_34010 [Burkholderia cepacia]|uniref:hypothetical protein n=1 Tax=Burkholderia TaxID=32008 RepID=UPI000B675ED3|nr:MULTISPECIES: hypothetical protein [Burkholderia]MBN3829860.1 hypothetical protein [Burkholderia sp. Ac-20384]MCA7981352.1 hypothetical protein [Burkholderia cepacia]OUE47464.1 hypothetical protein BZY94_05075 [Burkholderia territorii]HDR9497170.1 hypothetical protein [Burkholderia cepacia]